MKITEIIKTVDAVKPSNIDSIREGLLLANSFDKKKGEIYMEVAAAIKEKFPWTITKNDEGKWAFTFTDKEFRLTGFLPTQFPEWPVSKAKDSEGKTRVIRKTIEEAKGMKARGELKDVEINAYDAVNRFSSWFSGYKLTLLREASEAEFTEVLEKAKNEELSKLTKAERKDADKVKEAEAKALKVVQESKGTTGRRAPRVQDGKGNVNVKQLKNLPETELMGLEVELAKINPSAMQKALEAATGQRVVYGKPASDLPTMVLLDALKDRASKGEFKNATEAGKLVEGLIKLFNAPSAVVPNKSKGRKLAANA